MKDSTSKFPIWKLIALFVVILLFVSAIFLAFPISAIARP